jgi:hypothetical protein
MSRLVTRDFVETGDAEGGFPQHLENLECGVHSPLRAWWLVYCFARPAIHDF